MNWQELFWQGKEIECKSHLLNAKETDIIKQLQVYCACKKLNLPTLKMDFEPARWKIRDNEDLELLCLLYEFCPFDIQCYIQQIRKKQKSDLSLHAIKCNPFGCSRMQIQAQRMNLPPILKHYYLIEPTSQKEQMLSQLLYHPNLQLHLHPEHWTWPDVPQLSILLRQFHEPPQHLFVYDFAHVPFHPNDTFKKELVQSCYPVLHFGTTEDIQLLKLHLLHAMKDYNEQNEWDIALGFFVNAQNWHRRHYTWDSSIIKKIGLRAWMKLDIDHFHIPSDADEFTLLCFLMSFGQLI